MLALSCLYIQYVNDINKVKLKNEQKNRKEQHHKNEQKLDMGKYQVYNYPIYMTKATGARVVQSSNFFLGLCHRIFTERVFQGQCQNLLPKPSQELGTGESVKALGLGGVKG